MDAQLLQPIRLVAIHGNSRVTTAMADSGQTHRLSTLGGLGLHIGGRPAAGPAAQPRRLALLAVVAASHPRGITRDKVLGLLWPDADADRGRHALQQSLHVLRRELGAETVVGGVTLQIDPLGLPSDIAEFLEAVERGDHTAAVAAYRGPFLDGVFLDDAPEFERWLDRERDRFARLQIRALEALAAESAQVGDARAVIRWREQLVLAEPADARYVLSLIDALVEAGDVPAARRAGQRYQAHMRDDLELPPDRAVVQRLSALAAQVGETPLAPIAGDEAVGRILAPRYELRGRRPQQAGRPTTSGTTSAIYDAIDRERGQPIEVHVVNPMLLGGLDLKPILSALRQATAVSHPAAFTPLDARAGQDLLVQCFPAIDGKDESLATWLAREKPLPLADAYRITIAIADAIAAAHAVQVVHGDLRPRHVRQWTDGSVRVGGFALADALNRAASSESGIGAVVSAVRVGSPAYQSPEQLTLGQPGDEKSDQYALACLCYEMCTGEVPHANARTHLLISHRMTQPAASVRTLRETVAAPVDAVLMQALARTPADRFSSVSAFRSAFATAANARA
jgi:DNA-binding SARP family transcriptional activator